MELLVVMQKQLNKADREEAREALAGHIAKLQDLHPRLQEHGPNDVLSRHDQRFIKSSSSKRIAFGIEAIDRALDPEQGQGIEYSALHEIRSATTLSFASAAGFAMVLGNHMERARYQDGRDPAFRSINLSDGEQSISSPVRENLDLPLKPIFWIADRFHEIETGDFYGPGLYPLGINPARLIRVLPRNLEEAIWAAGEISRSDKVAFAMLEVRGNPGKLNLSITRKLLLRCQSNNMPLFILRQAGAAQSSAVSTRWCVEPALSRNSDEPVDHDKLIGMTAWNISLEKCRGGKTGDWRLEWNHHEQTFQTIDQSETCQSGISVSESSAIAAEGGQILRPFIGKQDRNPALSGDFIATTGN